jgi:hypothetical protein
MEKPAMPNSPLHTRGIIAISPLARTGLYLLVTLLMANLSAIVDAIHHPEIPYFDEEHLIVGGVTAVVSMVVFGLLGRYAQRLEQALRTIRTLERYISICAQCKQVREPGADPEQQASWQPLEVYITAKTTTQFSHGLCPQCMAELYPQYKGKI